MKDSEQTYQMCTRCVMDTTDPNITFDENGHCNHCRGYLETKHKREDLDWEDLEELASDIRKRKRGKNKEYDCLLGVSGGVDSTYVAYLAKELDLNPLVVHLDNGWNSELAVKNIEYIVSKLGFDLHTHVIDWEEFRDLQLSYFKASVIDIEAITDHAILGITYKIAYKSGIKYILSGANHATEAILPQSWVHNKLDYHNIKAIHTQFGTRKLETFPFLKPIHRFFYKYVYGIKMGFPLDYIDYNKNKAKQTITKELGWRDYGGKHHESLFTKFYQVCILPKKFNVDKRKAHLSTLICSGQITREEALEELEKTPYDPAEIREDKEYVRKKLGLDEAEFDDWLANPPKNHLDYSNDYRESFLFQTFKKLESKFLAS